MTNKKYEIVFSETGEGTKVGSLTTWGKVCEMNHPTMNYGVAYKPFNQDEDRGMRVIKVELKECATVNEPLSKIYPQKGQSAYAGLVDYWNDLKKWYSHIKSLKTLQCSTQLQEELILLYNGGVKVVEEGKDFDVDMDIYLPTPSGQRFENRNPNYGLAVPIKKDAPAKEPMWYEKQEKEMLDNFKKAWADIDNNTHELIMERWNKEIEEREANEALLEKRKPIGYRLLKDLPDCKAGAVYNSVGDGFFVAKTEDGSDGRRSEYFDRNKDWFSPLNGEEESIEDERLWKEVSSLFRTRHFKWDEYHGSKCRGESPESIDGLIKSLKRIYKIVRK